MDTGLCATSPAKLRGPCKLEQLSCSASLEPRALEWLRRKPRLAGIAELKGKGLGRGSRGLVLTIENSIWPKALGQPANFFFFLFLSFGFAMLGK